MDDDLRLRVVAENGIATPTLAGYDALQQERAGIGPSTQSGIGENWSNAVHDERFLEYARHRVRSLSCSMPESLGFAYHRVTELSLTSNPTLTIFTTIYGTVALVVFVFACSRSETVQLKDTEGRSFTASLKVSEVVSATQNEPPNRDERFTIERKGHLVAVCPGLAPSARSTIARCRALVCRTDQECPPAHGLKQGTCINGLCIEPSNSIGPDDAIMLCLAGTGVGDSSPSQIERFALGLNCGEPCKVPTPCRQPQ